MRTVFANDYVPGWKTIATEIKEQAGWRCVRCDHPHEPEAGYTLRARAVTPIKFDVALATQGDQVGESVCLFASGDTETPEWLNVRYRKFLGEIVPVGSAMLASMLIPMASLVALLLPVRPIVGLIAALPMWAVLAAKVLGKPLKSARIAAKSLGGFARSDGTLFAAVLAAVGYSLGLARRRASNRAVLPMGKGGRDAERYATRLTGFLYSIFARFGAAGVGTKHFGRRFSYCKGLMALRANPCFPRGRNLASGRAVNGTLLFPLFVARVRLEHATTVAAFNRE